ncbi:VWA domain-containing protein [Leucobacter allii]|uniref:VWA domain-containing protein n=1 Tax=Leucobacter allii TaxID=2932247 RepID=A0ABY4FMN5_9MICO|nr:vWA domain-containing protein [Leucobacter allii]UOQ57542.1 VWA domain-containing protein [Leucobacter allii]
MLQGGGSREPGARALPGVVAPGETDEPAELIASPEEEAPVDPAVRALARQIAARLAVRRPRRDASAVRGIGALETVPYRGASDEIDLDATLEVLAERPVPDDEDILVRERLRTTRSVVLLVDVSGSMKGERIRTAAATVGALTAELSHDALAVVAFWSDAAVLLELGGPVRPMELLERILRIPARGLTNVAFPLEVAAQQLARVPAREARVILLSDCVHNAGPDPRVFAARLPRVDVLLDASGEKDIELGREIASRGRGTCHVLRSHRDVAPALSAIFGR